MRAARGFWLRPLQREGGRGADGRLLGALAGAAAKFNMTLCLEQRVLL